MQGLDPVTPANFALDDLAFSQIDLNLMVISSPDLDDPLGRTNIKAIDIFPIADLRLVVRTGDFENLAQRDIGIQGSDPGRRLDPGPLFLDLQNQSRNDHEQ